MQIAYNHCFGRWFFATKKDKATRHCPLKIVLLKQYCFADNVGLLYANHLAKQSQNKNGSQKKIIKKVAFVTNFCIRMRFYVTFLRYAKAAAAMARTPKTTSAVISTREITNPTFAIVAPSPPIFCALLRPQRENTKPNMPPKKEKINPNIAYTFVAGEFTSQPQE